MREALDLDAMRRAAQFFVGAHDFRNFCKMDVTKVKHFNRVVYDLRIEPLDPEAFGGETSPSALYAVFVEGTAFLWHQVLSLSASFLFLYFSQNPA